MSAAVEPAYTPGRNQDCAHVRCAGFTCLYAPPEVPPLGPELPRVIQDSEGKYWRRYDGQVYYREHQGPLALVTWSCLQSRYRAARQAFPEGMWTVHFAGEWS